MARKYVRKIGPTSWVILPPSHQNLVTVTTLNLQISWNWLENWHFETWQTEILDTKELAGCIVCRSRQLMWSPKICIKYRKYWKSYVSFQLSGQIGLIWAVRNYFPNWQQFLHARHMTIFKLIFKKMPKSEKFGIPCFQTKKMWF